MATFPEPTGGLPEGALRELSHTVAQRWRGKLSWAVRNVSALVTSRLVRNKVVHVQGGVSIRNLPQSTDNGFGFTYRKAGCRPATPSPEFTLPTPFSQALRITDSALRRSMPTISVAVGTPSSPVLCG